MAIMGQLDCEFLETYCNRDDFSYLIGIKPSGHSCHKQLSGYIEPKLEEMGLDYTVRGGSAIVELSPAGMFALDVLLTDDATMYVRGFEGSSTTPEHIPAHSFEQAF